jgi:hypothetical protein
LAVETTTTRSGLDGAARHQLLERHQRDGGVRAGVEARAIGAGGDVAELLLARLLDDAVHGGERPQSRGALTGLPIWMALAWVGRALTGSTVALPAW